MGGVSPNFISYFLVNEMAEQAQRKKKTRQFMEKSKTKNEAQEKVIYLINNYDNLPCDVEPCDENDYSDLQKSK
jgi:hypothetical protein